MWFVNTEPSNFQNISSQQFVGPNTECGGTYGLSNCKVRSCAHYDIPFLFLFYGPLLIFDGKIPV